MTQDQKIIRTKVGLLELAKQLGNVSQACRIMGYSRDSFYRFKELYETGGEEALEEMSRRRPNVRNRVAAEVEEAVVALAIEQPAWGQTRVANELAKQGISISPAGVRSVWQRHDLTTMKHRLKALEAKVPRQPHPHRGSAGGPGEGQGGQGGLWRVRERMPWLLRRPGYLLCRHHEGRGLDLPADLHRQLF